MFWHFSQNNSGGSFDFDAAAGITHHVVIEAASAAEANARAQQIGLYFDGVGDCPCCGKRWSEVDSDEGTEEPRVYDEDAFTYRGYNGHRWMGENPEVFVHYLDGRIVPTCYAAQVA
jgi:hypothetical protein